MMVQPDSHWQSESDAYWPWQPEAEAETLPSSSESFWQAQLCLHDGLQGLLVVTRPVTPLRLLNPQPLPVALTSGRYSSSGKSPSTGSGRSPGLQPASGTGGTCCDGHNANASILSLEVPPAIEVTSTVGSGHGISTLLPIAHGVGREPGSHHDDDDESNLIESAISGIDGIGTYWLPGSGGRQLDHLVGSSNLKMTVPPCRQLWRRGSCSMAVASRRTAGRGAEEEEEGSARGSGRTRRCGDSEPAPEADPDSEGVASLPLQCNTDTTGKIACSSACQPLSHHSLAGSKRLWSSSLTSHGDTHSHPMRLHGDNEDMMGQGQGLNFESALSTLPMPLPLAAATPPPAGSDSTPMRRLSHWADGLATMIAMEQTQQSQAALEGNDCDPQKAMIAMEQAQRLLSQPASGAATATATGSHRDCHNDNGGDLVLPQAEADQLGMTTAVEEPARQELDRLQPTGQELARQHQLTQQQCAGEPQRQYMLAPPTASATVTTNHTPNLPLAHRLALLVCSTTSCSIGKRARISQPAYRPAVEEVAEEAAATAESRSEVHCEMQFGSGREMCRLAGKGISEGRRVAVLAADWRAQWRQQRGTVGAMSASLETRAATTARVATAGALARRWQCEREDLSKLPSVISQSAIQSHRVTAVPRDNPMHEPDKASLLLAAASHICQLQELKKDLIG